MVLFKYNYKLLDLKDILKIKKINKLKKINILDFGCGDGVWEENKIKDINKIILFDKNKELIPILKSKYKSNKIIRNFNKKIIFTKNLNLIIFSSVIQYMSDKELKSTFKKILKVYKNKKLIIFINDHPIASRYIELFMLPFINWEKLLYSVSLIFNWKYLQTSYFKHNIFKKKYIVDNFKIKDFGYLKGMPFLRKKFLLTLNKKK